MTITYADDEVVSIKELVHLYESVGWLIYAADPDSLARAVDRSSYVVTARNDEGDLIGLARCLSDDVSVMYLQDILVHPDLQRQGVGSYLAQVCLTHFAHVRQKVLLTDDDPALRQFYESLGYSNVAELETAGLLAYLQITGVELR